MGRKAEHSLNSRGIEPTKSRGGWLRWPAAWGLLTAFGFYQLLPYLPIQPELAVRYFCGHPIEYVTTTLFFLGIALLLDKLFSLRRERAAVRQCQSFDTGTEPAVPRKMLANLPATLKDTLLGQRLADAAGSRGEDGAVTIEHLKYLAELAGERLHNSYALVRTINWAVPILGFLGTVIGITMAIANIRPEQLSSSLGDVTSNLAVAFDTTALALALSLVLVFTQFLVERAERAILETIESFALRALAPMKADGSPLQAAEQHLASRLIAQTDEMLRSQAGVWQNAVSSIQSSWNATLEEQRLQLSRSLVGGLSQTLHDHAESLQAARTEIAAAVTEAANRYDTALNRQEAAQAQQIERLTGELKNLWSGASEDLQTLHSKAADLLERLTHVIERELHDCRVELHSVTESTGNHRDELAQHARLLDQTIGSASEIIRLEGHLSQNLESLRAAETLQDAVHSLTAAAHLLTARTNHRKAA